MTSYARSTSEEMTDAQASAVYAGHSKIKGTDEGTSAPISPHDVMVKRDNSLPTEYWASVL